MERMIPVHKVRLDKSPSPKSRIVPYVIPALGLSLLSLAFRVRAIAVRYFDADEMEHLRGAFCVFNGWLPYKDFFEHHTPLIYYLLAPLYHLGIDTRIAFISRILILAFAVMIFYLVFQLSRQWFNSLTAWISLAWLSYVFMFFAKSLEIRPDIPALAFFLWGIYLLVNSRSRSRTTRAIVPGIFFALSFLFTQKMFFLVGGAFLAIIFRVVSTRNQPEDRQRLLKTFFLLLLGFLIPLALTGAYFYLRGGLGDFLYRNFTMNLLWKRRVPFYVFFQTLVYENPFFVFWAAAGFMLTTIRFIFGREKNNLDLLWFPALLGIVSLLMIPVVLPQTYALVIPLLVIPAANSLGGFLKWLFRSGPPKRIAGSLVLLGSGPGLLWFIGIRSDYRPELIWEYPQVSLPLYVILGGMICLAGLAASNNKARTVFSFLLAVLIISRPLNFMLNYDRLDNRGQLSDMRLIMQETDLEDRVMDTWPIFGCFRLPAYYYHFLHRGVLKMLTPEEKGPLLLEALRTRKPKIISRALSYDQLPPEVRHYIDEHYRLLDSSWYVMIRKSKEETSLPRDPEPED